MIRTIVAYALITLSSFESYANTRHAPDVCYLIATSKTSIAYLVNSAHIKKAGPINMGNIHLSANIDSEGHEFNTKHFIIIKPSSAEPINTPFGVRLSRTKSICRGSATYLVLLQWNIKKGEMRPYKFALRIPEFYIEDDLGYNTFTDDIYKFDARIVGQMVDP